MRQAGRYLPEYQVVRKQAGSFVTLCQTPELACEVTLQPLRRFELDAAIIFSDILVIPDAMGLGLEIVESVGPVFERSISSMADIRKLPIPDPQDDLGYVMDAVRLTSRELNGQVPLIGFSGSPWTLAVYMVEGRSKTNFERIRAFAEEKPHETHRLLEILAESVSIYLQAKAQSGADALMIFDTWGGILETDQYLNYSLGYMERIVNHLAATVADTPVIVFTKGAGKWLEHIAASGCHGIGLDWTIDIGQARASVGDRVALQGNLDPDALQGDDRSITRQVQSILNSYGPGTGHVFNLGHGIKPQTNPDKVRLLVDAVHELSVPFH